MVGEGFGGMGGFRWYGRVSVVWEGFGGMEGVSVVWEGLGGMGRFW